MIFQEFPKIPRLSRDCIITEKIDGTNGQIYLVDPADCSQPNCTKLHMYVGSRTRWLSEKEDNYGFYKWADAHREELQALGPGRHFGEWWGGGIQRGYGLSKNDKRFSLFNTSLWNYANMPPACCSVVPILYQGIFSTNHVSAALEYLHDKGSAASPGFDRPEGVVIYHTQARISFKKTLEKDEAPKGRHEGN